MKRSWPHENLFYGLIESEEEKTDDKTENLKTVWKRPQSSSLLFMDVRKWVRLAVKIKNAVGSFGP